VANDNGDRPANLCQLAEWAARTHGNAAAQQYRSGDGWQERSFVELAAAVREVAAGLRATGVGAGDRVALLAETSPQWTVCDLAILSAGAICVPIYPTSSAAEIGWVLADSGARLLILQSDEHAAKVARIREKLPDLQTVVGIQTIPVADVTSLDDLVESGAAYQEFPAPQVDPDLAATIVYTSGTTGNPKGCQLSHNNLRVILDSLEAVTSLGRGDVIYAYLPLAHLFTRMVQIVALERGAILAYTGGDIRAVITELSEIKPTHLPSVPRLFEKVYGFVTAHLAGASAPDRAAFNAAVALGTRVRASRERGEPISAQDAASYDEADRRLFSLVRDAFGGRVREALTGAAPIAPEILEFFFACGVPIYEAYGMTEATAVITANRPGVVRFGTVGQPIEGVDVRISDDGEICSRSGGTFIGYWRNDKATAEMIVDGWLHTGDLGAIDDDGFLRVTGRKKDIIITSGGKNLTPANLENDLRRCRWIAHAVMCGDRRPYAVALITLDAEEVLPWARENGLSEDLADLSRSDEMRALLKQVVDDANAGYAPPEQIRAFHVLPADFSVETGELTPTLKVRRTVVAQRHASTLDALYG
jgi:long-chain acyl-CoA synthetase